MGCCKCEEYGWDEPQPELNGTGHCIFHAPPEGKTVDNDEFNRRVFAHINNARATDKMCHLSGTEFPCAINFRHPLLFHPLPQIIFTESTFHDTASFKSTHFSNSIYFINARFKGHVSFDNSTFEKSFSIHNTQFDKECSFRHVAFNGNSTFDNVNFKHTSNFDNAKFNDYTSFNNTIFMSNSVFQHSQFGGITIFTGITFNNDIVFNNSKFSKNIVFENVTSLGDLSFTKSEFCKNASFTKILIQGSATFQSITTNSSFIMENVKIYGDTTFSNATFQGPSLYINVELSGLTSFEDTSYYDTTTFHGLKTYGTSSFNRSIFKGSTNFSNVLFAKHARFDNFTISKSSEFSYVKFLKGGSFSRPSFLERAIFSNCTFASATTFTKPLTLTDLRFFDSDLYHVDFLHTNINFVRFVNVCWPMHDIDNRYSIPSEHCVQNLKAVSEFYCQMKKRNRDEQNDAEASLWHYAEKEAQLKLLEHTKPRLNFTRRILAAYRWLSRYGEDPWQALKVFGLLMLILFSAIGAGSLYLHDFSLAAITENGRIGKFALTCAQYALLVTPTYTLPPEFAALALLFSRLLIPIQAAIFAFALRNKLHR